MIRRVSTEAGIPLVRASLNKAGQLNVSNVQSGLASTRIRSGLVEASWLYTLHDEAKMLSPPEAEQLRV
jgi:hypothetical protein